MSPDPSSDSRRTIVQEIGPPDMADTTGEQTDPRAHPPGRRASGRTSAGT